MVPAAVLERTIRDQIGYDAGPLPPTGLMPATRAIPPEKILRPMRHPGPSSLTMPAEGM